MYWLTVKNDKVKKPFWFCFRHYNRQTAVETHHSDLTLLAPLPAGLSNFSPTPFTSQSQSAHRILIPSLSFVPAQQLSPILQRLLTKSDPMFISESEALGFTTSFFPPSPQQFSGSLANIFSVSLTRFAFNSPFTSVSYSNSRIVLPHQANLGFF